MTLVEVGPADTETRDPPSPATSRGPDSRRRTPSAQMLGILSLMLAGGAALASCEPASLPEVGDVAGRYSAAILVTQRGQQVTDHMIEGSRGTLVLHEDGSLRVHVSGRGWRADPEPSQLGGSWILRGSSFHIDGAPGTVFDELELVVFGHYLTGTGDGLRIQFAKLA